MTQRTVNGKIAVDRILHCMKVNPLYKVDNAVKTIEIVFDLSEIALRGILRKETIESIIPTLEVNYEIALDKIMYGIKARPNFKVEDGIETLTVVFDVPGSTARKDIGARMNLSE